MSNLTTLNEQLDTAKRALAILENQAAGYTSLTHPAHLKIELEDKRKEVAQLEQRLHTLEALPGRADPTPPTGTGTAPPKPATPSDSAENPFIAGGAVPPELFVGRASSLALIRSRLGGRSLQSVSIVGERRIGKSSLLNYVHQRPQDVFPERRPVVVYLDLMRAFCHTRAGFTGALRRELTQALGHEPWPSAQDGDLGALSFALQDLHRSGLRLALCLDEVEELTRRRAEFDELLEELRAAGQMGQIGLLTASAHPLADLCRSDGLISPFHNIFLQDTLGLLAEAEWKNLVRRAMSASAEDLAAIEHLAGGHPFYTQLAAGRLWEARHGGEPDWQSLALADIQPHWQAQWDHLNDAERCALRAACGLPAPGITQSLVEALQRRGLLRLGQPFSSAYRNWIKDQ